MPKREAEQWRGDAGVCARALRNVKYLSGLYRISQFNAWQIVCDSKCKYTACADKRVYVYIYSKLSSKIWPVFDAFAVVCYIYCGG